MAQMTSFDTFPGIPMDVSVDTQKLLRALRRIVLETNDSTISNAAAIAAMQQTSGPAGTPGQDGVDGDSSWHRTLLTMGS